MRRKQEARMANPQCENGYTRIANELFDILLRTEMSGHCFRLCLLIIRKTYGFGKTEDSISLSQMMNISGLSKTRCSQIINILQLRKIITVTENRNGIIKKYRFNKDFESWTTVTEKCNGYRKVKYTVTEKCNIPLQKSVTTIDNITKEIITKEKQHIVFANENLFEELWKAYPNKDGKKESVRHFRASVKTEKDVCEIKKALLNYINCDTVKRGYIKKGSTWFNNWRDWIEYVEIIKPNKAEILLQQNTEAGKKFLETFKKESEEVF